MVLSKGRTSQETITHVALFFPAMSILSIHAASVSHMQLFSWVRTHNSIENFRSGCSESKHDFRIHAIKASSIPYFSKAIMDATTVLGTSVGVPHAKLPHPHKYSTAPVPSQPKACTAHLAKYNKSQLRD